MRVSFSSEATARAARNALEAYGYSAEQLGRDLVTDCPTLLAVPALERRVGLAAIEHVDVTGGEPPALAGAAPSGSTSRQLTA